MPRIVDQFGNPIDTGRLAEPQAAETGWLVREFEEHPSRGLTPARLHQIMGNAEQGDLLGQLDLADDMEERDAHLYAELAKRKGSVAALEWSLVAPEGASAAEQKLAEELQDWMRGLPDFEDVLLGMMDGVLKGFALHEMVWQLEDGVLLPQLTFRPQRWFTLSADRSRLLLRSRTEQIPGEGELPPVMGEELRPFTWLAHTPKSRDGYLARRGLLRVLAWPYLFKNYATRDLAEFLEIYGLPLRLGQYPAGASDAEKRTLLRAVTQIGHNAAGIIPQGMKVEFQNAAQGTHVPFATMMTFMDAAESKTILGQTLTAGEGEHGTQALGTVHNEVRMDIRASDVRQVEGAVSQQLVRPLALLNKPGVDPRRLPRIKLDIGEAEDLTAYAEALPALAKAGLRISVDWAHEKLRIPVAGDDDEILQGPPDPVAPGAGAAPGDAGDADELQPGAAKRSVAKPPKPDKKDALATEIEPRATPRDAIDDLVDEALDEWQPLLAPMVRPLLDEIDNAVAAGESLEAFAARLPELIERMDGKPMAERLARAAFTARLAGEADLDTQPAHEE